MFDDKHPLFSTYKVARRIAIGIVGGTVLLLGIIMMVTPGPGIAGILLGLGILGIEFAWARSWLKRVKERGEDMVRTVRGRNGAQRPEASPAGAEPPRVPGIAGSPGPSRPGDPPRDSR